MADTPQDVVAQERRRAPVAAATAALAGLLVVAAQVLSALTLSGRPRIGLPEALGPLVNQGRPGEVAPRIEVFRFVDANLADLLVGLALSALAFVATALALAFLIRAARRRRPDISALLAPAVIVAGVVAGLGQLILGIIDFTRQAALATAVDQSPAALSSVRAGAGLQVLGSFQLLGQLALSGAGFVYGSLNAMRVGLLTRFMGILGIAVGALNILGPFVGFGNQSIIQLFFLFALALLFLGRWPGGVPPAWVTGQAEPWPTQLELREARERERAGEEPEVAVEREAPPPAPAPAPRPHSSSKKKKRKRR